MGMGLTIPHAFLKAWEYGYDNFSTETFEAESVCNVLEDPNQTDTEFPDLYGTISSGLFS